MPSDMTTDLEIRPFPRPTVITPHLLDASAAVKLVDMEPGSENLRPYFLAQRHFYITAYCYTEALGVLKRKFLRNQLTWDRYKGECFMLSSYVGTTTSSRRIQIDTIEVGELEIFMKAEELANRHADLKLDLLDSIQLVTIKHGVLSRYGAESKTILITADRNLEIAGSREGLRVWNCQQTKEPPRS
jgi:predicted nucleic acid-binding protein